MSKPIAKKKIKLKLFNQELVLVVNNNGGRIESAIQREMCPSCGGYCLADCDGYDPLSEDILDAMSRAEWNASLDMIESVILAHACAGIDVTAKPYLTGLATVCDAMINNS